MKLLPQRTFSSVILIVALAAMLIALAVVQYRWSGQVSEAEHERMHTSLVATMNQFRLHFDSEFLQLGMMFQPDAVVLKHKDWKELAVNFEAVLDRPSRKLIRNIYLWASNQTGGPNLLLLDMKAAAFEPVSWPAGFDSVRERYGRFFSGQFRPSPEIRPFNWVMLSKIPLMFHPLLIIQPSKSGPGPDIRFAGFLLIELNLETIRSELLPELAKKYFEGPNGFIYQVVVASGRNTKTLLYKSDPDLTIDGFARPDAQVSLFENQRERFNPDEPRPPQGTRLSNEPGPRPPEFQFRPEPPSQGNGGQFGSNSIEDEGPRWMLLAKHSKGSLEIAVAANRMRNLALSLGSLMILAVSMGLIIVSSRRAQKLARLQIDFVAGISHELRTPLSVICSAADNLAEGVIEASSQSTRRYGQLIRSEGRKLTGMIEQILQFASLQRIRHRLNLRPENVNAIAEAALKQAEQAIEAAGFSVVRSFGQDLPEIMADADVLSHSIQNLVQNALKFSGESRWLAIRTLKVVRKQGDEVQLVVEDRGMGIEKGDLSHVFEPFYRGSEATEAQIHGTGLGLFMVSKALALMGGNITVRSSPGKGSCFTMHFPALHKAEDPKLA